MAEVSGFSFIIFYFFLEEKQDLILLCLEQVVGGEKGSLMRFSSGSN